MLAALVIAGLPTGIDVIIVPLEPPARRQTDYPCPANATSAAV